MCVIRQVCFVSDGDTATISLLRFNVSNPEGESVEFPYTVLPNSSIKVLVTNIPGDAFFVVLQAHSFLQNVTLAYDAERTPTKSVKGTNVGLWKAVVLSTLQFSLFYENAVENVSLLLAAQAYGNQGESLQFGYFGLIK